MGAYRGHNPKNQRKGFHTILLTDVLGFTDVLIKFWSEKVKGHRHVMQ